MTQITGSAANEIGLQVESGVLELTDMNGRVSNKRTTTQTIDIGSQRGEKLKIQISPIPDLGPGISGLLSTDLFLQYDIDLDFGANRLNYFSQDHCDGKVAYWAERPLAVVPVSLRNVQINVPVMVDGQEMNAIIDTGSEGTVMSSTTAKSDLNIELGSENAPVIATSKNNSNFKVYSHKFKTLSFEGITVQNPKIDIITDREFSNGDIRRVDKISDVIIGMNVLKHLHLYIAYKEKKLYISPAGTGESVLFKTAAAPAN
jgi:predicted aspartyl protease